MIDLLKLFDAVQIHVGFSYLLFYPTVIRTIYGPHKHTLF